MLTKRPCGRTCLVSGPLQIWECWRMSLVPFMYVCAFKSAVLDGEYHHPVTMPAGLWTVVCVTLWGTTAMLTKRNC